MFMIHSFLKYLLSIRDCDSLSEFIDQVPAHVAAAVTQGRHARDKLKDQVPEKCGSKQVKAMQLGFWISEWTTGQISGAFPEISNTGKEKGDDEFRKGHIEFESLQP